MVGDEADLDFPVPIRLEDWHFPKTVHPEESLKVVLSWRALGKIDAYYSVYLKLIDAQGNVIAGWDGQPRDGQAPTLLWAPGEEIEDEVTLLIPAGTPAGDYSLEVGMYRAEDLARCLTLNDEGQPVAQVNLGSINIQP